MTDEFSYKVTVRFFDGERVEFYAEETFDLNGNGRVFVWSRVSMSGEYIEYYSVPTAVVRDVKEKALE